MSNEPNEIWVITEPLIPWPYGPQIKGLNLDEEDYNHNAYIMQ